MRQRLATDVIYNEYCAYKGVEVFDAAPEWQGGPGEAVIVTKGRPAELYQVRQGGGALKLVGEHVFITIPFNGMDVIPE